MSRILIIDDEQDILDILQYNLVKEGFEVEVCNNGAKGIEIAKKYGCIIHLYDTNDQLSDTTYLEIKNNCWKNGEYTFKTIFREKKIL